MQHVPRLAAATALLAAPDAQRGAHTQLPHKAALPAARVRELMDADTLSALQRHFSPHTAPPRHAPSRAEPTPALLPAAPRRRGIFARLWTGAEPRVPAAPSCAAAVAADLAWAASFVDADTGGAALAVAQEAPAWLSLWRYQGL